MDDENSRFRSSKPYWRLCAMNDPSGRRGIWYRVLPRDRLDAERDAVVTGRDGFDTLELCAGREGDDSYARIAVGEVITRETMMAIESVLATGAWMIDLNDSFQASDRAVVAFSVVIDRAGYEEPYRKDDALRARVTAARDDGSLAAAGVHLVEDHWGVQTLAVAESIVEASRSTLPQDCVLPAGTNWQARLDAAVAAVGATPEEGKWRVALCVELTKPDPEEDE